MSSRTIGGTSSNVLSKLVNDEDDDDDEGSKTFLIDRSQQPLRRSFGTFWLIIAAAEKQRGEKAKRAKEAEASIKWSVHAITSVWPSSLCRHSSFSFSSSQQVPRSGCYFASVRAPQCLCIRAKQTKEP